MGGDRRLSAGVAATATGPDQGAGEPRSPGAGV